MATDVKLTLSANVIRLRKARNWTQTDLSRATNGEVSQSTVSLIERTDNVIFPAADKISALAKALGVETWRLLVEPDSEVVQLVNAFLSIDPQGRELIQQLVERQAGVKKD